MMGDYGVGRLVHSPILQKTKNSCVCNFVLAIDKSRKNKQTGERQEITHFFDFVLWDSAAQVFCTYAKEGHLIAFISEPVQETWEQDGITRSRVRFRVNEFRFLTPKGQTETQHEEIEV